MKYFHQWSVVVSEPTGHWSVEVRYLDFIIFQKRSRCFKLRRGLEETKQKFTLFFLMPSSQSTGQAGQAYLEVRPVNYMVDLSDRIDPELIYKQPWCLKMC